MTIALGFALTGIVFFVFGTICAAVSGESGNRSFRRSAFAAIATVLLVLSGLSFLAGIWAWVVQG